MTILYPVPVQVKSSRSFGRGILASRPTTRAAFTFSDAAWWAAEAAAAEDRHYDAMADEAEAQGRLDRGLCC
jgi:hypothetical protein